MQQAIMQNPPLTSVKSSPVCESPTRLALLQLPESKGNRKTSPIEQTQKSTNAFVPEDHMGQDRKKIWPSCALLWSSRTLL